MKNTIAREADLVKGANRIVVSKGMGHFDGTSISEAIRILNEASDNIGLKLRSKISGSGTILGNTMILDVNVPLDTRYETRNAESIDSFNRGWSNMMRDRLGVMTGGYVAREAEPIKNRVTIETDLSAEEIAKLLANVASLAE